LSKYDEYFLKKEIENNIKGSLDPHIGFTRKVTLGTIQLTSFEYKRVDLDKKSSVNVKNIADAVYASETVPGAFGVYAYDGRYSIDGGFAMHIDPEAAILRCLEQTKDQKDIVIDIVNFSDRSVIEGKMEPTLSDEVPDGFIEIARVMDKYPDVQYRYLFSPSHELFETVTNLLEYRPDKTK